MQKSTYWQWAGVGLITVLFIIGFVVTPDLPGVIERFGHNHIFLAAALLALLMCVGTVVAPVATVPLIPLCVPMLGPFITGIACWVGWTIGAIIAFLIARYAGRPFLVSYVGEKKLGRLESKIPKEVHFTTIIALRILVPVDVLSYVLGLMTTMRMSTYALGSLIGIGWFSFAFSYMSYALLTSDPVLFTGFSVASVIIVLSALFSVLKHMKK